MSQLKAQGAAIVEAIEYEFIMAHRIVHSVPLLDLLESGTATLENVAAELEREPQQVRSSGHNGWSCLHIAAYSLPAISGMTDDDILALVQLLVEKGADRDLADKKGRRAVCFAAEKGLARTTQFLMQSAVHPTAIRSISATTHAGLNLMHYAAVSGSVQLVNFLMSATFFPRNGSGLAQLRDVINARTRWGDIPAHYAARAGAQDVLAALERQGSRQSLNRVRQTPRCIMPVPLAGVIEQLGAVQLGGG